jgi:uncharacterized protein (TIGR03083 family)
MPDADREAVFELIAQERRGIAEVLERLSQEQLATQSLCSQWKVRDVGAHLLMPLVTPTPTFVWAFVSSGFSFDKANVKLTAAVATRGDSEIVAGLREKAEHRFSPPGIGPEAPLTDLLVHGLDIRRPLGIGRTIEPERLHVSLDFLANRCPRGFVPRGALDGLRLEADDIPWAWGSGPEARGRADDLMLAMCGRVTGIDALRGDGAPVLRGRLT